MSDILKITKKYDGLDDPVLAQPSLVQDITLLTKLLEQNPSTDDRERAKEFLKSLEIKIEDEIRNIQEILKNKPEALDQIHKNAQACVAYSKGQKG